MITHLRPYAIEIDNADKQKIPRKANSKASGLDNVKFLSKIFLNCCIVILFVHIICLQACNINFTSMSMKGELHHG